MNLSPTAAVEIAKALAALDAMTAERDHYKRELGLERDRERETMVASRLGLTGREAALLMVLHSRPTRPVSKTALIDAMYDGKDEPEYKIIGVFVCKIRGKLKRRGHEDVIETVWGRGYQITEAGVAVVDAAMMVVQ